MHNADMHHAYIKSLIIIIGGNKRNIKALLLEASRKSDVGFSSIRAAYYGRWISKNQFVSNETLRKLEQAADNARQTHDLVEFTELQIAIWETAPELYQTKIIRARKFIDDMREFDQESRRSAIPARDHADAGAAAPATGLAAAGAAKA